MGGKPPPPPERSTRKNDQFEEITHPRTHLRRGNTHTHTTWPVSVSSNSSATRSFSGSRRVLVPFFHSRSTAKRRRRRGKITIFNEAARYTHTVLEFIIEQTSSGGVKGVYTQPKKRCTRYYYYYYLFSSFPPQVSAKVSLTVLCTWEFGVWGGRWPFFLFSTATPASTFCGYTR